jgi:hypothetical protein
MRIIFYPVSVTTVESIYERTIDGWINKRNGNFKKMKGDERKGVKNLRMLAPRRVISRYQVGVVDENQVE